MPVNSSLKSGTLFHALSYLFIVQQYGHVGEDPTRPFDGAKYSKTWGLGKYHQKGSYELLSSEKFIGILSKAPPIHQIADIRYTTCLWHTTAEVNQNGQGDHVHPQSKGGYETAWYLCRSCQSSKGAKNLFEWMQYKSLPVPQNGSVHCLRISHSGPGPVCLEHAFNELLWLATKLDYQYSTPELRRAPAPPYYRYVAQQLRKYYLPKADWDVLKQKVGTLVCP